MLMIEGYNFVNPYADTQFAKNYSPKKFVTLKKGMHMDSVVLIIGQPLYIENDTAANNIKARWYYTSDGKLRKNKSSFLLVSDMAWYQSWFEVTENGTIGNIYAGWAYD